MYYLYEIKNLKSNNSYIGQTNNPDRRWREHKSAAFNIHNPSYDYPLYRAIRKYGLNNFSFSIIEKNIPTEKEINNLEIKYIEKYGYYNIAEGGSLREDLKILSKEESKNLILDLKNNNLLYIDICNKYDISMTLVSNINYGNRYFNINEKYPIRKTKKNKEEYSEMINLLENSFLSFSEIGKILNIGESTVKKINYGKLRRDLWDNEYPIRKISKSDAIKNLLLDSNYSKKEIMNMTNSSRNTVDRINNGDTHKDNNLNYPLRNL